MNRLKGKRAIVTGAASGIGRATALLFAAEGAHVLAVDRHMEALAQTSLSAGNSCVLHRADCDKPPDIDGIVAAALAAMSGIDVVFANAGINSKSDSFFEQTAEEWE